MWFSLGCAAQQVGNEELALRAFKRCVSLEADVRQPLSLRFFISSIFHSVSRGLE